MADTTREHELEAILVDLLDGQCNWRDIRYNTGLSVERCKEIEEEGRKIIEKYLKRNS